jgi:hypothetical protein
MSHYIKKLKKTSFSQKYLNIFCDFETVIVNEIHYVTCYSILSATGDLKISNIITEIDENNIQQKSYVLIEEFLDILFNEKETSNKYIILHNLSRFDGFFIIDACCQSNKYNINVIIRDNIIYKILIKNKKGQTLHFRDSYLLFPQSLDEMASIFCPELRKDFFEHDSCSLKDYKEYSFRRNILNYCEKDTLILAKCFELYNHYVKREFDLNILDSLTLASLAFKIFRTKYYDEKKTPIEQLNENKDCFVRQSYLGGLVDIYKPHLIEGYHYDVNSLYPYVMSKHDMPIGRGKWIDSFQNFDIENFFGFLEVEVVSPENLYIPFLPINDDKRGLIAPLGNWTAVYFSEEVKEAIKLGYKFKYIRGISYQRANIFKNYINDLYNIRLKNKNNSLNKITKLLLNSLYGRFGMKNEKNESIFIEANKEEEIKSILCQYEVKECIDIGQKVLIKYNSIPTLEKLNHFVFKDDVTPDLYDKLSSNYLYGSHNLVTAVQIASAITSYARIEMYKYKTLPNIDIYYSDTDSIFSKNELPTHLISDHTLGLLKYEGKIKEALFIAPKLYYVSYFDGRLSIKGKGIKGNDLKKQDFLEMYIGIPVDIQEERNFIRNFTQYKIKKEKRKHIIKGLFDKREKIYLNKKWVDTKALMLVT